MRGMTSLRLSYRIIILFILRDSSRGDEVALYIRDFLSYSSIDLRIPLVQESINIVAIIYLKKKYSCFIYRPLRSSLFKMKVIERCISNVFCITDNMCE